MRYLDDPALPRLSRVGLGTWQFGSREWGYGEQYARHEAGAIVRRALDLGVNLIDTAEIYGFGRSERIVGEALRGQSRRVYLATKLLPVLPVPPVVRRRARASARRLGVDRIDLYQVHHPNPLWAASVTMGGMRDLRADGTVGEVGVSNYPLHRWRAAEDALGGPVLSNQVEYSLVQREPERDLLPYAQAAGRVVIAYSPLAQGFLTGTYSPHHRPDGFRAASRLFHPYSLARGEPLLRTMAEVGAAHDASAAQVALAWLLHRPNVVAIPGASSVRQLEANVAAADLTLTDEEDAALTAAAEAFRPLSRSEQVVDAAGGALRRIRRRRPAA